MSCCFGPRAPDPEDARAWAPSASEVSARRRNPIRLPGCDLVKLLGEGSFGTVMLVRQRTSGEMFAVKVMNKAQLIEEDQLNGVITERRILRESGAHPFVVECHCSFQTEEAVVLVLEYLPGGDMYALLSTHGTMSEPVARFYAAEVVLAIGKLHESNFVMRDLKLENILLDAEGHIRLTDFGLAASIRSPQDHSVLDLSGTAIYQAPEILRRAGHGKEVDWWALGILMHVFFAGKPPFFAQDRAQLYEDIMKKPLDLSALPKTAALSDVAKDFLTKLLEKDPSKRLGVGQDDYRAVQKHLFFEGINWEALANMHVEPPIKPQINDDDAMQPDELQKKAYTNLVKKIKLKPRRGDMNWVDDFGYAQPTSSRYSIGLDFMNTRKSNDISKWDGARTSNSQRRTADS